MDSIYISKHTIESDSKKMKEFNEFWGLSEICSGEGTFIWNGKRYEFDCQHFEPTVTMRCIDDDSHITFGVSSELKNEFVSCDR